MNWAELKNRLLVELEFYLSIFVKILENDVIPNIFRLWLLALIYHYISGINDYLFIVVVGLLLGYGFHQGFSGMVRVLSRHNPLTSYSVYSNTLFYFFRRSL